MGEPQPPRDIVAMSYGCTCPYGHFNNQTIPPADHETHCRYGEPAAVNVAAWQDVVRQLAEYEHLRATAVGILGLNLATRPAKVADALQAREATRDG